MGESVIIEKSNGIATIFLNEPESLNALSHLLKDDLMNAVYELENDALTKVIILAGKGRAFCAGGDINAMGTEDSATQTKQSMDRIAKLIKTIQQMSKPFITAVHGYAVGAGFSIALASDIIIAGEDVKFGLGFKRLGAIPDCGAHYFLYKAVGPWKTKEWIWTGAMVTAKEGKDSGFVNKLVPNGREFDEAQKLAIELSEGPIRAYGYTKTIVNQEQDLEETLQLESFGQSILFQTSDHQEGVKAFREKRDPKFIGE